MVRPVNAFPQTLRRAWGEKERESQWDFQGDGPDSRWEDGPGSGEMDEPGWGGSEDPEEWWDGAEEPEWEEERTGRGRPENYPDPPSGGWVTRLDGGTPHMG